MTKKIIHTADWHIGRFQGEDGRFDEIKNSLKQIGKKVVPEKPDLIVIAGDIFHQAKTWSDRAMQEIDLAYRMIKALSKVAPVMIVRGTPNHDGAAQYDLLKTLFKGNKRVHIATTPEIFMIDGIAVAAVPGFDKGIFRSQNDKALSSEEENVVFTQAVADTIIGLSAQIKEKYPDSTSVLASHFTVAGANMESGQTAMMSKAEPVVAQDTLLIADYTVNCFGHIHRPQQIGANTFYCGAPFRLNFNDEGQERGFFVHEVDETGLKDSRFIPIESREFLSLSMTKDETTVLLNEGTYPAKWDDVEEKIVRASYECSSQQKDSVNPAAMQKYLLSQGAYAVCDIVRKDIDEEEDKAAIENKTPLENFKDFFEKAGSVDFKENEILEKAENIINKVLADQKETPTGQLLIKKLQWENYRSFKGEGELDFRSISFATLNGKNGVGKSSVFEMIIDCLFEKPREHDLTGWISNDPKIKKGSLMLIFSIGDREFKVTRTRLKSGKATLNIAEKIEEAWVNKSKDKAKDTQKEIEAIIGLDTETLKATCLILQDQYGTFLETDKETRMLVLAKLFNLSMYEDMKAEADDKLSECNKSIRQLKAKETVLVDDVKKEDETKKEKKEKQEKEEDLQKQIEETQQKYDEANTLFQKVEQQDELQKRLNALNEDLLNKKEKIQNAEMFLADEEKIKNNAALYRSINNEINEKKAAGKQHQELSDKLSLLYQKRNKLTKASDDKEKELNKLEQLLSKKEVVQEKREKLEAAKKFLKTKVNKGKKYNELDKLVSSFDEKLIKKTCEIDKLKEQMSYCDRQGLLIKNSNCPISEKASCNFLKEAVEAKKNAANVKGMLDQAEKEWAKINNDKNKLVEKLDKMGNLPDEINKLKEQIDQTEEKITRNENKLLLAESNVLSLKAERKSLDDQINEVNDEITSVNDKLVELKNALEEYESLVKQAEEMKEWEKQEKLIPVAKERRESNQERIKEIQKEIGDIQSRLKEIDTDANAEDLSGQIKKLADEKEKLQTEQKDILMELGGLDKTLKDIKIKKEDMKKTRKELKELSKESAQYEFIKLAFSNDGIPKLVLKGLLPEIEETATRLFSQMNTFESSISFVTEKTLKNKKEVDTLDIVITDGTKNGTLPYLSKSGGEKVKAALSVILALADVRNRQTGIQPGFLFIDEPPFLDDDGVQAYCDALESIRNKYPEMSIMAITHDMAMRSRFPECITVEKTDDGSKIYF